MSLIIPLETSTVGALKKALEGLPDDMEITYYNVEWQTGEQIDCIAVETEVKADYRIVIPKIRYKELPEFVEQTVSLAYLEECRRQPGFEIRSEKLVKTASIQ